MSISMRDSSRNWVPVAGCVSNSNAPIGAIFPFGGTSAPSGYLLCDGSAVSRSDYSALFNVIGTSFGSGDGSTTFNVPDFRGKFAEGTPSGGTVGTSIAAGLPNITGSFSAGITSAYTGGGGTSGAISYAGSYTGYSSTGSGVSTRGSADFSAARSNSIYGNSTTVQPPAVCVNYVIKAKDVNLSGGGQALADRVSALETLSQITVAVPNGGVKLAKYGRIVQASFQIVGDNLKDEFTSGVWTNYGSSGVIPEIYRPLNTVYCGGLMVVSSPILMRVATNGNLGYYYTGGNLGYEYEWSQSWISAT